MIYPDVTIEEWLKRYPELSPPDYSRSCHECGTPVHTYKPFIEKDWVGFESNECECGSGFQTWNQIANSEEAYELMENAFKKFEK